MWNLIVSTFALANTEETEPDFGEIEALEAFHRGEPDYQPTISHKEMF